MNLKFRRWYRLIREKIEASRINRFKDINTMTFSIIIEKIIIWVIEKINFE